MKGTEPYLVVNGLMKHYGDGEARVQVLDGITTEVMRGEVCVMLGPSGSGKSTFLNLIGGLEGADGGSVSVAGADLTDLCAAVHAEFCAVRQLRAAVHAKHGNRSFIYTLVYRERGRLSNSCHRKTTKRQKKNRLFKEKTVFGGSRRRIRTLTNRVRVCRATFTQFG